MNRIRNSIAIKSIAGIVLLLTIFCVIVGQIGYQGFSAPHNTYGSHREW